MQGGDRDLQFAAAVLEGRVQTTGPWRCRPQQQQQAATASRPQQQQQAAKQGVQRSSEGRGAQPRHRGQTDDGGGASGSGSGGGSKKARHGRQQQHPERRQQPSVAAAAAAAGPSHPSGEGSAQTGYSLPGPGSTAHVLHCTACDVFVPRRTGDWEVHVAGIRHRRQLLSLRTFGEPNRLVLSAFENPPDSAAAAQRLVGSRAAHAFGLLPAEGGPNGGRQDGQASAPSELLQAAGRLRMEALKQLLGMFGVGQMYNSASAVFQERQLAACLQQACQTAEQQRQQQRDAPSSSSSSSSSWTVGTGAELAGLVHLALTGRLGAAQLAVTMLPPADVPRSQHAGLAAALPLLLPCLHSSASLASLHLVLPAPGADTARVEQLWQQAWQQTLPALRTLLESSTPLRTLRLTLPACLRDDTQAYLPQLQAAAAAAPVAVRQHVLLALHPRAGRCSLLQLLPLAVVREILELAAPLQPCAVHIAPLPIAAAPLPLAAAAAAQAAAG